MVKSMARSVCRFGTPRILLWLLSGCLSTVCCGGGGGASASPPQPTSQTTITSVTVSPNSSSIIPTASQQFTASVQGTGSFSSAVNWSINDVSGGNSTVGTITAMGLYVAPTITPAPAVVTVKATSVQDSSEFGTAAVTINVMPPQSTFFSTAAEEAYSTYQLPGDGDLWPSCWADDDNLYAANGDGTAFTGAATRYDLAVSAIGGMPPALTGSTVATNVGTNWSGSSYNRKPTGMLCTGGAIYLAFQNLNSSNFNDAPAASIAKSSDHGVTWTWDASGPMFGTPNNSTDPAAYKFTTVFFLDYGKNSASAIDSYVYAYGLDNNWREQQALYLARVPNSSIQNRSAWQFYSGATGGVATWSSDIGQKLPVLVDQRLLYPVMLGTDCPANQAVIGQGGVVYDAPLQRYIFSSWSCTTHEIYEAPNPWGPWSHVLSNDFGPLRSLQNRGQYGTSIPAKFISTDGKTLYLQSNVCCGGDSYTFSLRKVYLQTYSVISPTNSFSNTNLASVPGTQAISKSTHFGLLCGLNCSDLMNSSTTNNSEDDFDEELKPADWWGYTWPQTYNFNRVVYQTGNIFADGGWFSGDLRVQVRQNFQWIDISGITVAPSYPYSNAAGSQATYTFSFPNTWGDGVRIIGTPGGTSHYTSVSQLSIYYTSP